ncbi:hypothetical protein ACWDG9_04670 [Streptomyces sp. NPDC001073]
MKDGKAWVGDTVHDEIADKTAIVTDVQRGSTFILRPPSGGGESWVAQDPSKLTVVEPAQ